MSCHVYEDLLRSWDPDGADLGDDTALHLDECDSCRALFDARFALADLPAEEEVPGDLAERVMPAPKRSRRSLWLGMGIAAITLLSVGAAGAVAVGTTFFLEPGDEVQQGVALKGTTRSESELLMEIGYLKGHPSPAADQGPTARERVLRRPPHLYESLESVRGGVEGGVEGGAVGGVAADPDRLPRPDESTGETYVDHGTHGFVRTTDDRLSTFAVDVDTASYTLTRRKLRDGWLPPAEAVRVEEFVNYLPYEYAHPASSDAPFAVDMEAAPSPFHPGVHLVRIGVQGRKVSVFDRKPVHLTFLVDTSGSMGHADKLPLAQTALEMLVEQLEDGDTVAIVAYAGQAGLVLEPTPMSRRDDVVRAVRGLSSGGSTAMGAGIELAYDLADRAYAEGAVNRVVILSDGDANVGPSSRHALTELVEDYAGRGITLTTLGFGQGNYKDATMERLANEGDGNYFYIDSRDEARRVFVDRLTGTLQVIARDVKLQVEFDPRSVRSWRQVGYENRALRDRDFRDDAVDAGEIGAGHQVTALYEVVLSDSPRGNLALVRVRAEPPGLEAPAREWSTSLPVEAVRPSFAECTRDTRMAVASASFAEVLRASPWMVDTSLGEVLDIARAARRVEYAEDVELIELIERARELR